MSDAPEEKGTPAWVMTFADLMSLLMCFFVLLLAFSEMDVMKFKQLSGSMKEAFGVQADMKADFIPKGTSVVTTEFSPGRPDPTVLNEIRQHTIDSSKSTLEFKDGEHDLPPELEEIIEDLERIKEELKEEIENGNLSVEREGSRIVIRIHEQGSFASGYADIQDNFLPTLDKISALSASMNGIVQITGHTDNVPIANQRFRSNWELSSSRAVTVAHRMLKRSDLDPRRIVITGLAWTQPVVDNDTPANRALNRRVEINIVRSVFDDVAADIDQADSPTEPPAESDLSTAP
ncbi:MAG: flagellar motor protein MotB [Pseudomonadota bacterium]